MISAKKLIKLARKWQRRAALKRKRITTGNTDTRSISVKAEKGYFAIYSADRKRFLLPLEYLNSEIMRELFNMAEGEFGLPGGGPLTLPCEAELVDYAIALIKQQVNSDIERAFLTSVANSFCSLPSQLLHQEATHQLPIRSF